MHEEFIGDIVNGVSGGVVVAISYDRHNPRELLWELTYTLQSGIRVRQEVRIDELKTALRQEGRMVHQGSLTFFVSSEGGAARLYVGTLFPDRRHIVTSLPKGTLEEFCRKLT